MNSYENNLYKHFVEPHQMSIVERQNLKALYELEHDKRVYNNSCSPKGNGEYSSTIGDQMKRLKHYVNNDNPNLFLENVKMNKFIQTEKYYQYQGMKLGLLLSSALFFFPGLRLLKLTYRIPICALGYYLGYSVMRNYGKDLLWVVGRPYVEYVERNNGSRNYWTGF